MSRAFSLEALGICLEDARRHALCAGMDLHFIADIDHLSACVKFNKTMDSAAEEAANKEA